MTCLDPRDERRWSIRWEAEPREISQTARARLEDEFRDATARRFPPEVPNQTPPIQTVLYADSAFLAGVSRGELGIEALEVFRIAGGR